MVLTSNITSSKTKRAAHAGLMIALGGFLLIYYFLLWDKNWSGSQNLHTMEEITATLLALFIGILSLVRYHSQKQPIFLYLGAGFLGTALLDGFHGLASSVHFIQFMPSDLNSISPWTWLWARMFLACSFIMAYYAAIKHGYKYEFQAIEDKKVYLWSIFLSLTIILITYITPFPSGYFTSQTIERPADFIPGVLFLIPLIGFIIKKEQKSLEIWLTVSIAINAVAQLFIMPNSQTLYDVHFEIAHCLKILSYLFILAALLINMSSSFRREVETVEEVMLSRERLNLTINTIKDSLITIDGRGLIISVNPATVKAFGYSINELIGRNISLLAGDDFAPHHDKYLRHYAETGEKKIIDIGREVVGRKKDGTSFPIELTVSEIFIGKEKQFLGVIRDISDRKEAEKIKTQFVSSISHELRTPLTSIKGALGMMNSGALGNITPEAKSMLKIAGDNAKRLIELVNNLLDFEKLQTGSEIFQFQRIALNEIAKDAIATLAPLATEKGIRLSFDSLDTHQYVRADGRKIGQVIINLLSNAIKFAPESSTITILCKESDQQIIFEVSDEGPGIGDEFKNRVFERFSQEDGSDTRETGGSGLGLSISKSIIASHNGKIGYQNNQTKGATFYFILEKMELFQPMKNKES